MKRIFLFILLLGLTTGLMYSQRTIGYAANLGAFAGVWEYHSNDTVFRVILRKGVYDTNTTYLECLLGGYYLKKGDVVLDNYLLKIPARDTGKEDVVIMATNSTIEPENVDPQLLRVMLKDQRYKKRSGFGSYMKLLSPTTAEWVLVEDEGPLFIGDYGADSPPGFSVPSNVILTKIKEGENMNLVPH